VYGLIHHSVPIITLVFETYGISVGSGNPGMSKVSEEALQIALSFESKRVCKLSDALEERFLPVGTPVAEAELALKGRADPLKSRPGKADGLTKRKRQKFD